MCTKLCFIAHHTEPEGGLLQGSFALVVGEAQYQQLEITSCAQMYIDRNRC